MTFLEDLRQVKTGVENRNKSTKAEVLNYFREEFTSGRFEEELKKRLIRHIRDNDKEYTINIYSSTCYTDGEFVIGWLSKKADGNGIHEDVVDSMVSMVKAKMWELNLPFSFYRDYDYEDKHWGHKKYMVTIELSRI